jgi:prepilin-type N-terminal cleavage/methylation domain-containing protein
MQSKYRQTGFTLVEIAIVLVIIGLLLGGILKGQEMITQARIKNVVNDFNGITAAYFAYQDRYRAVPGDDLGAATRWIASAFPPSGAVNGTGDGVISGTYQASVADLVATPPSATAGESNNFWWHLRLAGFVSGATGGPAAWNQPVNAVGGYVGVQNGSPGASATAPGLSGLVLCSANVPDKIASAVDTAVDDQRLATGQMLGYKQGAAPNPDLYGTPPLYATGNYEETGSNQYVICKKI